MTRHPKPQQSVRQWRSFANDNEENIPTKAGNGRGIPSEKVASYLSIYSVKNMTTKICESNTTQPTLDFPEEFVPFWNSTSSAVALISTSTKLDRNVN